MDAPGPDVARRDAGDIHRRRHGVSAACSPFSRFRYRPGYGMGALDGIMPAADFQREIRFDGFQKMAYLR